jgi:glycosyltransferase involved in cell wall biosynthesis
MKHDTRAQFKEPADTDKTCASGDGKGFKILLMTEAAGSGVGRHILDLAQGLAMCGHDVHLLYSPGRAEDRFLQRISELEGKIKVAQIPMDRSVNPKHDLSSLAKIKEYIKENGPFDFVHGHSSKAGALARLLKISGAHSARIVYTPHAFITLSPNLSGKEKLMYRIIERGLGSLFTDAIVAVSHHEAEHASNDIGIPVRKVNVIANGVDIDDESAKLRESYRKSIGAKEEDVVIGFSGRLDYQKAPEVLLKAFLSISADSRLHLVMLGDGPKREELEEMIKDHPAAANIHLLGYHPFASAVLSALDVFVLPSRYEGLPYVLLEAMAMGLPIVATSVGGNGELVRDGVNGFLVSPDSVDELSNALSMLSSDANIREFFGRSSFEMVKDSYRTQLMIDSTIELYRRLRGSSKCS